MNTKKIGLSGVRIRVDRRLLENELYEDKKCGFYVQTEVCLLNDDGVNTIEIKNFRLYLIT